jgi:hypothetical protein
MSTLRVIAMRDKLGEQRERQRRDQTWVGDITEVESTG